ncbi:MAG: hypothetical protein JW881_04785 [Spirochaetales bacterium]|nr:hypothetical protein [Spirochaetales bacterium]
MKKTCLLLLCVLIFIPHIFAQEEVAPVTFLFGPRVGVSAVILDQDDFNDQIQKIISSDDKYFPVFTEIGFSSQQQIDLGDSNNYLVIEQNIFISGLDQRFALPFITLLMCYRMDIGLEAGIGPFFSFFNDTAERLQMQFALTYSLGWNFKGKNFSVPLNLYFIPYPSYGNPRFTFTAGINFEVKD